MKFQKRRSGYLLILFLLFALSAQAEAVKVFFTAEVVIDAERMYLGQVARVEGEGSLVEKLRQIDLGPAPRPNKTVTLSRDMILSIILKQGISLKDIEAVNLTSKGILVKRSGQLLDPELVYQKITEYIEYQLPNFPGEFKVVPKGVFPETYLPLGDFQLEIDHRPNNKLSGYSSIPVKIIIANKDYTRIFVPMDVRIYQTVVMTIFPIERGAVIKSEMVEERYIDTTDINGEFFRYPEEVVGKMAKRSIAKEAVILKDYLEIPKLVRRNEQVVINAISGSVFIQMTGKAMQDGALGEIIDVLNESSGIKVKALVTGAGQVQVKVD